MDFSRLSLCLFLTVGSIKCSLSSDNDCRVRRDYTGLTGCIIRSDTHLGELFGSDVSVLILKQASFTDLLNVRISDKKLSKGIIFYEDYSSAVDLTTGWFPFIWGVYFQHEKTQKRFEMLKDGKLEINGLKIDNGSKEGVKAFITEWQSKKPSKMFFSGNFINDAGALTLVAETVVLNKNLSDLRIDMKKMSEADQKVPAFILHNCPNLKRLQIVGPMFYDFSKSGQLSDDAMDEVEAPLSNHKNIEIINFGRNNITDKGALTLVRSLKRNESLRELYLHDNKIGERGIQTLKEVGAKHKKLHHLDVSCNKPDIDKEQNYAGRFSFNKDI